MNALTQTATETEILRLSQEKFRWKTEGQIDRLADLFDDALVFVHLNGHFSSKQEWIEELRTKRFIYNAIDLQEASARAYGDTAVLVGKARFRVTMHGAAGAWTLIYTEVYARKGKHWKLVNLHTTAG
ncbi:nuclear transport factor 2 family protein [Hymenobacter sp. DH14]|uniref:Nuclear transport factor 2 family protein n=1 Tax=Hymenobacter cyanobacteriorum TaxID=2926463 RepID=A0A9X1VI68_9BACT|nr:nuclear transport factor 2 family protein [Hymenobacter cyanobacteriorum]MCI1189148.1 nuclear transport factor 2 family protein [Hymenobacter cyanobacteriorum]